MSWKYKKSLERIESHVEDLDERGITVSKLTRKTDDLEALVSETDCREIFGAHVYGEVTNFTHTSSAPVVKSDDYKKFLRGLHVYQAELSRIIERTLDAYFVHFQGDRFHALFYRPIDDEAEIAKKALLLQLGIADWVEHVFNPYAKFGGAFSFAAGADVGTVIATRNGPIGGQELLFLGPPANNAAKLLKATSLTVSKAIYAKLPQEYKELCAADPARSGVYLVTRTDAVPKLLREAGITWDHQALRKRLEDAEAAIALGDINYAGATDPVDFSALSIRQNKRVLAATVYADVDGFTNFVASRTGEDEQAAALRVFHAIRRESGRIGTADYAGVQVQFQGDRIQLVFNVRADDAEKIALTAVQAAIALNTAMETSLRDALGSDMTLHYAIGVDLGVTLITRLGQRGDRDNVCLGEAVANAAVLQERFAGAKQIVVSATVHELLPEIYAKYFKKIDGVDAYVSTGLTLADIEKADEGAKYATIGIVGAAAVVGVGLLAAAAASKPQEPEPLPPPKSWCP